MCKRNTRDQDRNNSLGSMACRRRMNSGKTGIDEEASLFNDQNESGNVKEEEVE
jgi:hypothetical protein